MIDDGSSVQGRRESYGERGLTLVDRFGVYLSTRRILSSLPNRSRLSVLDLGCGYAATHLKALDRHLLSGFGIDFRISEECKRMPRMTFIEAPIEEALPTFSDDLFDLVLMISVLEHLPDPVRVLRECHRVMRPEAMFFINVPTWRGKTLLELSAFRLGVSPSDEIDDHKMYYDKRDLWPLLVKGGFKPSLIQMRYHKFGLNLFAVVQKPPGEAARNQLT